MRFPAVWQHANRKMLVYCSGCGASGVPRVYRWRRIAPEGWRGTDAYWCPKCAWLA